MLQDIIIEKLTAIEDLLKGRTEKPLTFTEGAAYLGLSKSTLYKLTSKNQIPHYKARKRIYFRRVELEAWILRNPVKTTDKIEQEADDYLVNGGKPDHMSKA